jgi:hypothetical protein
MKLSRRFHAGCAATLGLVLGVATGCQTWEAGMTLPSPWYLQHPPQYFPTDPVFPLTRELAEQERINAQGVPGGPPAPLPLPIPGAAGAAPAPLPPPVPAPPPPAPAPMP